MGVNPKKWHHTENCVGCGKCVKVCPINNITLIQYNSCKIYPKWGQDCEGCCACFHVCPKQSVQYGKITKKAKQYNHFWKWYKHLIITAH